ncbi:MAG: insulinase family protein [Gemmatimonadetes bacterium]|nr:insulinase family protein [Gemmatimonadota bacterium]
MFTGNVTRTVLPNGLTLLIQREASAPVLAVVTHVRAGYFDEPDEWVGIAHVLEHMFFKGTARRGPGDLARETQLLGGYLNASTIYDKTVYYTVLPSGPGALARAVDIQSDALMSSALDQGELSKELEVVIQEAKRKLDNPPAVAGETLYQLLFQVHPMRRWRIGTEEGLRRLSAADLRAYYGSRYTPERVIVGLVGDLDPEGALELATRVYGAWTLPSQAIPGSPPEPDGRRPAIEVLHGDIQRPLAVVGWRTVAELHPDTPALDIAATVLGSGRASWLSRFVRTPGLAAAASASHYTPTEVGVFDLALQSDEALLDQAVERTLQLTEHLATVGPDEPELFRVRSLIAVRWSRAFETMDGRASALCEFEALGGYRLADEIFQRAMQVSADDVRRVARTYLRPDGVSAVMYLPKGKSTRFGQPGGWPPDQGTADLPVGSPAGPAWADGKVRSGGDRKRRGEVVHLALDGIDFLVQPKRGAGLVSLGLLIPGMREEEDASTAGVSWLLARSALRGVRGMNAEELALAAESLGGSIGATAGLEALGWSITVPTANLSKAARLLRAVALEATLDPQEVAIERGLQAADAARVRDDMFRYPLQRVLGVAYPGDPYGLPPLGEPDNIRALDDARLRSWRDRLHGRRAVAVAVGDLEPEQLLEELSYLNDWPGRESGTPSLRVAFRAGREVDTRDKAQSALAMAFSAAPAATGRRFAIEVLADFLSGLAGRLFQVLREERALAYTVMASPWLQQRAGVVFAYIATSPDRESEARDAMLQVLDDVARGKVSEEEVERARTYAAGAVALRRQTAAAITGEILSAWVDGLLDELSDLPQRLRAVTVDDVVREARQIFDTDLRAEFVVRGAKRTTTDG